MNEFSKALVAEKKNGIIPDEHDYFGWLVGQWDIEWIDDEGERTVKGEWIFSWILDGTAIQDVFIVPSRAERAKNPQPDAEYGTSVRIYNPATTFWDVFYGCTEGAYLLEARRQGDEIVLTEIEDRDIKWIFSDMKKDSFHWRKMHKTKRDGWEMIAEVRARRSK